MPPYFPSGNEASTSLTWPEAFHFARTMAVAAHGDQRYGEQPYSDHLEEVVAVLHRFGATLDDDATAPLLVAAWLHDSVEDTDLEHEHIAVTFGPVVADLVWRVTDEPGRNRKERKAATYPKIAASEAAILLKLADRIANVESSIRYGLRLLEMYRKEQRTFEEALRPHSRSELSIRMWAALDELLPSQAHGNGQESPG